MKLPRYNQEAEGNSTISNDLNLITKQQSLEELCKRIYGCNIENINDNFNNYLVSEYFKRDSDFSNPNILAELIRGIHSLAIKNGFPNKLTVPTSYFDAKLGQYIYEFIEAKKFEFSQTDIDSSQIQSFFTQRIAPLITFWRWINKKEDKETTVISIERVKAGRRNYFNTLLITAWLSDKGINADNRWEYHDVLTADNIVAIIERTGLGYRKGFARALAKEIIKRNRTKQNRNFELIIRGAMKRATFSFSSAIMLDSEEYYEEIADYLCNWSENNFISKKANEEKILENSDDKTKQKDNPPQIQDTANYWFGLFNWSNENFIFKPIERTYIKNIASTISSTKDLPEFLNAIKIEIQTKAEEFGYNDELNNTYKNNKDSTNYLQSPKFYLKILTENELGYRNGKLSSNPSQAFYISKYAIDFFPTLSKYILNDSTTLLITKSENQISSEVKFVFHNDTFNTEHGSRDEYRIYLNKELANSSQTFEPEDIIILERISYAAYNLTTVKPKDEEYKGFFNIIKYSKLKGGHALEDKL